MPRKRKKSKISDQIPTRTGVLLILFVIFVLGLYTTNKAIEVYGEMDASSLVSTAFKKAAGDCRNRSFEGSADIHAWYEKQGSQYVMRIADEDMANLPLYNNSSEYKQKNRSLKIIDLTPELEQKLKLASASNPVLMNITGYVYTCQGEPLGCLEYSQSKVKPFMSN